VGIDSGSYWPAFKGRRWGRVGEKRGRSSSSRARAPKGEPMIAVRKGVIMGLKKRTCECITKDPLNPWKRGSATEKKMTGAWKKGPPRDDGRGRPKKNLHA